MIKLIVATSNSGKLKEMQSYLAEKPLQLALKPSELDIEETGKTFMENAILKATQVAQSIGEWAIADDSGLMVESLDGAPGLYSARYGNTDEERINRLLNELQGYTNRQAKFVCAIAISNPQGEVKIKTEGVCHGEILRKPRGEGGFGYDPIFFVPEVTQTFAEMPPQLKRKLSHRGKAFEQLLPLLDQITSTSLTTM